MQRYALVCFRVTRVIFPHSSLQEIFRLLCFMVRFYGSINVVVVTVKHYVVLLYSMDAHGCTWHKSSNCQEWKKVRRGFVQVASMEMLIDFNGPTINIESFWRQVLQRSLDESSMSFSSIVSYWLPRWDLQYVYKSAYMRLVKILLTEKLRNSDDCSLCVVQLEAE